MAHPVTAKRPIRSARSGAPWRFWLRNLLIVVVVTGVGISLIVWWEDRPLASIRGLLERGSFEQALEEANAYLRGHPDRGDCLELKAQALAGLDRWGEAARLFDRVGARTAQGRRAWSQTLLRSQKWSAALPMLLEMHALNPADPELLHELAATCGQLGDYSRAAEFAEQLMQLPDQELRGRLMLGTLRNNQGNYRKALEAWKPILDSNPEATGLQVTPAEFFLAYGRALKSDGKSKEAATWLERSRRVSTTAEVCVLLAECAEEEGDLSRAEELWREALELNPEYLRAREGLAREALERNAPGEALQWIVPYADRADIPSSAAYLLQRAYTLTGKADLAASWEARVTALREREQRQSTIDNGIQRSPDAYWSRAVRAHRFASQGNRMEAMLLLERLLREDAEEPFVRRLAEAVQSGGELPSLDEIPMKQF